MVNTYNVDEDMTAEILRLNPVRWKVFQCLLLDGENAGPDALRDARDCVVSDEDFKQVFVALSQPSLRCVVSMCCCLSSVLDATQSCANVGGREQRKDAKFIPHFGRKDALPQLHRFAHLHPLSALAQSGPTNVACACVHAGGAKIPSKSILEVGVQEALREYVCCLLLSSH